jgi:hypothetical protein
LLIILLIAIFLLNSIANYWTTSNAKLECGMSETVTLVVFIPESDLAQDWKAISHLQCMRIKQLDKSGVVLS